jgi:predicted alpha/beta superfamily hydrolase
MNYLKSFFAFFLFYFSLTFANAQTQFTKIEAPGLSGVKFKSTINGLEYVVYIQCPENFDKTNKKYPVIYVTDAQWHFSLLKDIYNGQLYDGLVPEVILVGITWTGDYEANRGRDFTPTPLEGFQNSGNAAKFLSIIKDEIMPHINSNYPVDKTNQALYGVSLGGIFALYTLFDQPDLFNRFIILSPSVWGNSQMIFQYEEKFAQKKLPLNVKIFFGCGEYELPFDPTDSFNKFSNQLRLRNYKGLEMESAILEKMGHGSVSCMGISRGLQFIYKKPDIKVETSLLEKYTGNYQWNTGSILITQKDNTLYGNINGLVIRFYAETNEKFYMKGLKGEFQYKKDENGKVIGYQFFKDNFNMFFKKLD